MPFPEKRFFDLDEIVDRWSKHGVDHATLVDYARQDLLTFAAYLPDVGSHRQVSDRGAYLKTREVTRSVQVGADAEKNIRFPVWYLTSDDAARVLSAGIGQEVAVQKFFRNHFRNKESGTFRFQPKMLVASNLVITRSERDRFERSYLKDLPSGNALDARNRVRTIARRFPSVVQTLKKRFANRGALFQMNDEADMQDLFRALLAVDFDNVVREDYVPQVGGRRTRIDFLLPDVGIGIELKMTRPGLGDKEVGDQLIQDIVRYENHPLCRTLMCIVFDRERNIENAVGLERLSSKRGDYEVEVLVVS